jgi:hypothetical protein
MRVTTISMRSNTPAVTGLHAITVVAVVQSASLAAGTVLGAVVVMRMDPLALVETLSAPFKGRGEQRHWRPITKKVASTASCAIAKKRTDY